MRSLEEMAAAAVDASQSDTRTLTLSPSEYQLLIRQIQLSDGRIVDTWDQLVFRLASGRGLGVPLPDVKVIVDTVSEIPSEARAAIDRVGGLIRDANRALRSDKVRGPTQHLVTVDEAADGWEALEQHAFEQGWDDDE